MEITRRFIKFLEELEDPQVQDKYMNPELEENLLRASQMLANLSTHFNKKPNSINDLQLFENTLADGCAQICDKLKETTESICLFHVYATNFPINSSNVYRFLTAYCHAIFECESISLISPNPKADSFMKMIDGQEILEEDVHEKIVKELNGLMADKAIYALDKLPVGALEPYLAGKKYVGNIVIKHIEGNVQFYLFMHFKKDSPFTGSFITGNYYEDFPSIFNLFKEITLNTNSDNYTNRTISLLDKLEALKVEIVELYKRYFLSYIATETQTSLECEVGTSITLDQPDEGVNKVMESKTKSVQIFLVDNHNLELKNNFQWDSSKLNQKLSVLWEKLNKTAKTKDQRTLYHFYMQKSEDIFFEFSNNGNLVYQNRPIQSQELKSVIDIRDFLSEPGALQLHVILGKYEKTVDMIQSYIRETEDSKSQIVVKQAKIAGVPFEFIGKRREGKRTVEAFAIVFKEEKKPLKKINNDSLDSLIDNLDNYNNDSSPALNMQIQKVKRFLSSRQLNTKKVFGENADINALRQTIVSEYLPEELTTTTELRPHKSISSVNKIKLDITSKTAFIDSPVLKKSNLRYNLKKSSIIVNNKPATFSLETLMNRGHDQEIFDDWSFDAITIEDGVEKSRLVWAMLNEFDLIREFNIDLNILCEFISKIKEKYCMNSNAFHNYEHGITVMHGSFYILRHISTKFTSLVNLGVLVSAFCHDANHTGRSNLFEVNSGSRLAIRYHDKSVLEQHHAAIAFKVLSKETCNIFSNIRIEDYKQLRKLIISNILATDMKVHFEVMNTFSDLRNRIDKSGEENFAWNDDDVTTVTNMIVHCSDLCGPTKSFQAAFYWAQRINEEFSIQVREEEALGIPVTPYFRDLDKPHIMAKQEIAFISFMIKPLWESFNKFVGGAMDVAIQNIESNLKEWNILLEDSLKKKEQEEKEKQLKEEEDKQEQKDTN